MRASKTPRNIKELEHQSTLVKEKCRVHQNSSPTPINDALDKIVNYAAQINLAVLAQESHKAAEEVRARQNRRSATLRYLSLSLVTSFKI
jgi:hypothetical protein